MRQDSNPTIPSFLSAKELAASEGLEPQNEQAQNQGEGAPPARIQDNQEIEQRIREKAYEIWNLEGQPEGHDREHWERATVLIHQENSQSPTPAG
ncbi:hypothetical protein GCM10007874_28910 [Labrys miyagiensis]|uniref:DUF2934 domain-containing protein n=1 Tax=Labrys miyagiensis TaxID=346912 RepID=A0ABQ6CME4_9HYPH|nr:DUF2934 domain-containing protein [Labrys miyagiensis]GLS19874.1 hypothetical protein GCM10007874_28910 [Labrys miyagiensis]